MAIICLAKSVMSSVFILVYSVTMFLLCFVVLDSQIMRCVEAFHWPKSSVVNVIFCWGAQQKASIEDKSWKLLPGWVMLD